MLVLQVFGSWRSQIVYGDVFLSLFEARDNYLQFGMLYYVPYIIVL